MSRKIRLFFLLLTAASVVIFSAVGTTAAYADDGTPTNSPSTATAHSSATQPPVNTTPAPDAGGAATNPPATDPPVSTTPASGTGPAATNPPATDPPVSTTPASGTDPAATNPPATQVPVDTTTPVPAATEPPATEPVVSTATAVPDSTATAAKPTSAPTESGTAMPAATAAATQQPSSTETAAIPSSSTAQLPSNTTVTVLDAAGSTVPLVTQNAANAIATTSDPIWCPAGQSPTPGANGCTATFTSFNALLTYLKANETNAAYQQAGTIYVQMGNYTGGESNINLNSYGFNNLNKYNLTIQGGWDTTTNTINNSVGTSLNASINIGSSGNPWTGSLSFNDIQIQNISNGNGLTAYSQSDINLSNVQVSNISNGNGATLSSSGGNVTISGGQFNNANTGAVITAGGDVTIKDNAQFKNNKKAGAVIQAGGNVDISNSTFSDNGVNYTKNGDGQGLNVTSSGNVSLFSVYANANHAYGANIQAAGIVFVGNSFFSGNTGYKYSSCGGGSISGGYGLQIVTSDSVAVDSVTASNNYLYGASLTGSNISVTNSVFDQNGSSASKSGSGYGLNIASTQTVSLYNVEANSNQSHGANIQATGNVAIGNSFFSGNQGYTYSYCGGGKASGYGLKVVTGGPISVDSTVASNNYLFGASLQGSDIRVSNSTFDNNGSQPGSKATGHGLDITSSNTVALVNVETNSNQLYGTNIKAAADVSISSSFFSGNEAYTYSCHGLTPYTGYGLQVVTPGVISLDGVTASNNYLYGASLTGANTTVSFSTFDNNGSGSIKNPVGQGLKINSSGNVSLYAVEANNNQVFGAKIKATGNVSVASSFFSGNEGYRYSPCAGKTAYGIGLEITSTDFIYLDQVTAQDNGSIGTKLINQAYVTVQDSTFDNNGTQGHASGLYIKTSGQVTLDNVTATNNSLDGVDVRGNCTNNVLVIDGTYANNNRYGLKIVGATLTLNGSPIFFNNPAGNIFVNPNCPTSSGGGDHGHGHGHGGCGCSKSSDMRYERFARYAR